LHRFAVRTSVAAPCLAVLGLAGLGVSVADVKYDLVYATCVGGDPAKGGRPMALCYDDADCEDTDNNGACTGSLVGPDVGGTPDGTNSVCFPYHLDGIERACSVTTSASCTTDQDCPPGEECVVTASDLITHLGGSTVVDCVLKLDIATDGHFRHPAFSGTDPDHPCHDDNDFNRPFTNSDFVLEAGAGYRVVLKTGATLEIEGLEDGDFTLTLYQEDEPTGSPGPSATGMNDYCPPYNRVADTAIQLFDELNGCPVGECSKRCTVSSAPCTEGCTLCYTDGDCSGAETCKFVCDGGENDGDFCESNGISISRYVVSSAALQTYAGILPGNDFALESGESYRIQVASTVAYIPPTFGVDVVIESNPPAPCAGPKYDGGYLYLGNREGHARVSWDGGETQGDTGPPFRNLVFDPNKGPTQCPNVSQANCVSNCPGPGSTQPEGCDSTGILGCGKCGCEIHDGLEGWCSAAPYVRCLDNTPCGAGTCVLIGHLEPNTPSTDSCDQVQCNNQPPLACPGHSEWEAGRNCCDQHFTFGEDLCQSRSDVRCTVLRNEADVEFRFDSVSLDDEATWFDPNIRGISSVLPFKHRNYCSFVCYEGTNHCKACVNPGDCPFGVCVSNFSLGRCSKDSSVSCEFTAACQDDGDNGFCLGFCE